MVVSHGTLSRRVAGQPPVEVTELCEGMITGRHEEGGLFMELLYLGELVRGKHGMWEMKKDRG